MCIPVECNGSKGVDGGADGDTLKVRGGFTQEGTKRPP